MNIHLTSIKAFLEYLSVQLLDQYIDVLKLIILENKLIVIRNLEFSRILITLKRYLEIIDYFKQYISYYFAIIKSL